ncbi:hypothetical protein SERLADRAFT_467179 [Serpula lacrymans var. lacrymans S7.9]|uniref:Uncharacterized protein n=1 Tax=Serpula lacrymans var. lacrymans (strain S7.9) TaxID=578457 RepID=F8NVR6_SERL9|nr:uncharacterized protein SERLADRAFT_467179 [Serpula lacrymans var. lacrymans S7.9]EGO24227.1 hypothetical protein SERLADRAFT_467179 [Serpula lacrymans var. lacrymans S7.9]
MSSSPSEEAKSRSPFFPPQSESSAAEHQRQGQNRADTRLSLATCLFFVNMVSLTLLLFYRASVGSFI